MSTRALYTTAYHRKRSTSYFREIALGVCLVLVFAVSLASAFTHPPSGEDYEVLSRFGP